MKWCDNCGQRFVDDSDDQDMKVCDRCYEAGVQSKREQLPYEE